MSRDDELSVTKLLDRFDARRRQNAQFERTVSAVQESAQRDALAGDTREKLTACAWLASALGNLRLAKALWDRGADVLPLTRASGESTNVLGGYLVPEETAAFIIAFRDRAIGRQYGSLYRMATDNTTIPRRVSAATPVWIREGAVIPESNWAIENIGLSAKKFGVFGKLSTELAEDSATDVLAYMLADIGSSVALAEDDCIINGDGGSGYGGILGICPRLLNGSSAGKVAATSTHKTAATIDGGDMANLMAALPDRYWSPNTRIFCSAYFFAAGLARLGAVSGGELWDADSPSPGPLWNGIPCVLTPKLPGSGDQSTKIMALFGDLSKCVVIGSRRDLTLDTSVHRFLDLDQIAYRCVERWDAVIHNCGDTVSAGAIVGLQGTT